MYLNPKTGYSSLLFGGLGLITIISRTLEVMIICGIVLLLFSLLRKRIAIEPVHHCSGDYRWALTRNGNPVIWLWNKRKRK